MTRPVTIHSDGTSRGTVVVDEDGNSLGGIVDIAISIAASGVPEATIEVVSVSTNVRADLVEVIAHCPVCQDMMTHTCDPTIGGAGQQLNAPARCGEVIEFQDPWTRHVCIRDVNHDQRHFDGERAWAR